MEVLLETVAPFVPPNVEYVRVQLKDNGISVEIPIRFFAGHDSKTAYRYSLSPWTRDGAQDIDRYLPLLDRIGRNAGVLLDRDQRTTYRGAG